MTENEKHVAALRETRPAPTCGYKMAEGRCNAPIMPDRSSYSGYSHVQGRDWLHWASPKHYGPQDSASSFVPCEICGKNGPDNSEHLTGHKFVAAETRPEAQPSSLRSIIERMRKEAEICGDGNFPSATNSLNFWCDEIETALAAQREASVAPCSECGQALGLHTYLSGGPGNGVVSYCPEPQASVAPPQDSRWPPEGWDDRDYRIWSDLHVLQSYGPIVGDVDNPTISRRDVIRLLERAAKRRFANE
jgi:hypothetical protein